MQQTSGGGEQVKRSLRIRPEALELLHKRHPNKQHLAAKLGISRATLYRQINPDGGVEAQFELSTPLVASLWEYFKGEYEFDEIFEVVATSDTQETREEVA